MALSQSGSSSSSRKSDQGIEEDDSHEIIPRPPALESPMYSDSYTFATTRTRTATSRPQQHHRHGTHRDSQSSSSSSLHNHGSPNPRRRKSDNNSNSNNINQPDWAIDTTVPPAHHRFPTTVSALVDDIVDAIGATLHGQQKPSPVRAHNSAQTTWNGRLPYQQDIGRMGIELENLGAILLPQQREPPEAAVLRHVALQLALRLTDRTEATSDDDSNGSRHRPVLLYFNQIRQSLVASQELQRVCRQPSKDRRAHNITIHSMSDTPVLPDPFCCHRPPPRRKRGPQPVETSDSVVDPEAGIIILVQPTDYNGEFRPPGPAIGAADKLQQLVAQATVSQMPVICLSPRFVLNDQADGPWVLRDFLPAIYTNCAGSATVPGHHSPTTTPPLSKPVRLVQSVVHPLHAWHWYSYLPTGETYEYLLRTASAAGRPTAEIVELVCREFVPPSSSSGSP